MEFVTNPACAVMTRSKTSLTKEEIEEFWRKRKLAMEEHLKAANAQSNGGQTETVQFSLKALSSLCMEAKND